MVSSIDHPLRHLHDLQALDSPKFKYVESKYAESWVQGGRLPINSVSYFQAEVRNGIFTPDERIQRKLEGMTEERHRKYVGTSPTAKIIQRIYGSVYEGGVKVAEGVNFEQIPDEGIVLCFARRNRRSILDHLKKNAPVCIEILDVRRLYDLICEQLDHEGLVANCSYTSTINRNHFLKGKPDEVMEEFRMFWPIADTASVELPPGIGRIVPLPTE